EESTDDSVSNDGRRSKTPFRDGNGGQPEMMPDSCRQEWIPFKRGCSVASVRYVQDRHFSPPYRGWLFSAAVGSASRDKNCASTFSLGIGFGIADDILIIMNRFSIEVDWMRSCNKNQWSYILPSAGIGIKINEILKSIKSNVAVRFETGYAINSGLSSGQGGFKLAVGIESATIPLGFTYTGACFRLKVQRIWLQNRLDGVFLETVLY
ncbi:MAG TPA: hypothetical protein VGB38_05390, partial [bacterium]